MKWTTKIGHLYLQLQFKLFFFRLTLEYELASLTAQLLSEFFCVRRKQFGAHFQ